MSKQFKEEKEPMIRTQVKRCVPECCQECGPGELPAPGVGVGLGTAFGEQLEKAKKLHLQEAGLEAGC